MTGTSKKGAGEKGGSGRDESALPGRILGRRFSRKGISA